MSMTVSNYAERKAKSKKKKTADNKKSAVQSYAAKHKKAAEKHDNKTTETVNTETIEDGAK